MALHHSFRRSAVILPVTFLVVSAGVAIAYQQYFRRDVPRTGHEQRLAIIVDAPVGSISLHSGTAPGIVASARNQDADAANVHLGYIVRNQTFGILRVGIGTDEGMLYPNDLANVWRTSRQLSLASARPQVQSDQGQAAPVTAMNGPMTFGLPPLITPSPSAFFRPVHTDAGTRYEPVIAKSSETEIFITREIPSTLQANLGFGSGFLDLTGLPLEQANIATGGSKTNIVINTPNPLMMGICQLTAGVGECNVAGISNLNASKFVFSGAIGKYSLGFEGRLTRDLNAYVSVGLGSCYIRIPPQAGRVQIFYDDGLLSSFTFSGLTKRGPGYVTSPGFNLSNSPVLTLRLTSGMGKMTIVYQ